MTHDLTSFGEIIYYLMLGAPVQFAPYTLFRLAFSLLNLLALFLGFGLLVIILSKGPREAENQTIAGMVFAWIFEILLDFASLETKYSFIANSFIHQKGFLSIAPEFIGRYLSGTYFLLFVSALSGYSLNIKIKKDWLSLRNVALTAVVIFIPLYLAYMLTLPPYNVFEYGYRPAGLINGELKIDPVFVVSPKVSLTGLLWFAYVAFANIYGIMVLIRLWKKDSSSVYKGKIRLIIIAAFCYSILPAFWGLSYVASFFYIAINHLDVMILESAHLAYLSMLALSFIIFCILLIFGMKRYWFLKQKEFDIAELARVGKYTANILHDLKSLPLLPKLASIKSALFSATEQSDSDKLVKSRDEILKILETLPEHERNLQAMFNVRLSAFSKLDGFDYRKANEIHINHIIRHEMQKMIGPYIERYEIAYIINDSDTDYFIRGDSDLICGAIFNLIKNAIDAISERKIQPGNITVTLGEIKNDLVIDVCDNGGGIPEETARKLFQERITTKKRGTGIGLHHAMTIINAHGGQISLFKTDQAGTVFRITLPIARKSIYSEE